MKRSVTTNRRTSVIVHMTIIFSATHSLIFLWCLQFINIYSVPTICYNLSSIYDLTWKYLKLLHLEYLPLWSLFLQRKQQILVSTVCKETFQKQTINFKEFCIYLPAVSTHSYRLFEHTIFGWIFLARMGWARESKHKQVTCKVSV